MRSPDALLVDLVDAGCAELQRRGALLNEMSFLNAIAFVGAMVAEYGASPGNVVMGPIVLWSHWGAYVAARGYAEDTRRALELNARVLHCREKYGLLCYLTLAMTTGFAAFHIHKYQFIPLVSDAALLLMFYLQCARFLGPGERRRAEGRVPRDALTEGLP